ncbi:hypothetical protein EX895_002193 [Sporisorium graminicola]|uniref:DRBM domain-containing protein n=1 Tax=Sporisorium graminicola TaxID=280036 RepID=A0A4U7L161_9BASI|nr:hypothetical protein EX895_002193 [Sporisorium graminicola]TKY88952.1 hypothetical protein EX895_002193 [Sporisorium graminicola]
MIKPDITQHARTSANLAAAGGKTIPEYLEGAFPHKHTSDAVAVASIPASACVPDPVDGATAAAPEKLKTFDEEVLGYPLEGPPEVPFYIKFKGKGKGRPVMYDFDRSSVAQVYEYAVQMSVPEPVFSHITSGAAHMRSFEVTVSFHGLRGTHTAGSIKKAKELACASLIEAMLARNRDESKLSA